MESSTGPDLEEWSDLLEDDRDFADEFNRLFDNTDVPEADDNFDPDTYDDYINKEISVDQGDVHPVRATVTKRLKDNRGNPIGTAHPYPIMDSRMYEFEFADGHKQTMAANIYSRKYVREYG